jgi:hypothetical protein
LNNPCLPELFTEKYPSLPGVIGLGSLFSLFAMELWMHSKMPHAHSHGSATGEEFSGRIVARPLPDQNTVQPGTISQSRDWPLVNQDQSTRLADEKTMLEE